MRILSISGSLRSASSHSALLDALSAVTAGGVETVRYEALSQLPPFNPDVDDTDAQTAVADFRRLLDESDAVAFCTPEYAHGVPGALKNALDWVVGSGELVNKPVAVISAAHRGMHATSSLLETLRVMSARVVDAACISVALLGHARETSAFVQDPETAALLRVCLDELVRAALSTDPRSTPA